MFNNEKLSTYGKSLSLPFCSFPQFAFILRATFTKTNRLISRSNLSLQRKKGSLCGCCILASVCSHRSIHITSALCGGSRQLCFSFCRACSSERSFTFAFVWHCALCHETVCVSQQSGHFPKLTDKWTTGMSAVNAWNKFHLPITISIHLPN